MIIKILKTKFIKLKEFLNTKKEGSSPTTINVITIVKLIKKSLNFKPTSSYCLLIKTTIETLIIIPIISAKIDPYTPQIGINIDDNNTLTILPVSVAMNSFFDAFL